jgi:hypothetical protein
MVAELVLQVPLPLDNMDVTTRIELVVAGRVIDQYEKVYPRIRDLYVIGQVINIRWTSQCCYVQYYPYHIVAACFQRKPFSAFPETATAADSSTHTSFCLEMTARQVRYFSTCISPSLCVYCSANCSAEKWHQDHGQKVSALAQ